MSDEATVLVGLLDGQRSHVLGILEGLSNDDLRRSVLPSGWNCLAMLKHLSVDEHYWFRCIVDGEPLSYFAEHGLEGTGEWIVSVDETPESLFDRYREEITASNAIMARTSLDAPPGRRDEWWGEWKIPDVRTIVLHMIEETSCHAGHLDVVRELLDGRQWVVR